jgi:hypothetical protein
MSIFFFPSRWKIAKSFSRRNALFRMWLILNALRQGSATMRGKFASTRQRRLVPGILNHDTISKSAPFSVGPRRSQRGLRSASRKNVFDRPRPFANARGHRILHSNAKGDLLDREKKSHHNKNADNQEDVRR